MKKIGLVLSALMIGALFPQVAYAAPTIEMLNPSAYTTTISVSDVQDENVTYHLVAWAKEVPSNPLVEFQIDPPVGNEITLDATPVGSDTWEANLTIPGTMTDADGYQVTAILYSNLEQVDASNPVLFRVNNDDIPPPPPSQTVEMTYPDNGGSIGFYTRDGETNALIDVIASDGARQVRAFYTTSAVGTAPTWTACGSARVVEVEGTTPDTATVRCVLTGSATPQQVTAVAAAANSTPPPAPASAVADESGDAHRVFPYIQVPSAVQVSPESKKENPAVCLLLQARVFDQSGRPMANVNVDAHATGPNDQLKFGHFTNDADDWKEPDKGGHSTEDGVECEAGLDEFDDFGTQGEHNVPAAPDRKHIESEDGTDNSGAWGFALRSVDVGGTFVSVWADVTEDDVQSATEPSDGARIGWGQDPPAPQTEVFVDPTAATNPLGSCVRVESVVKQSGSPIAGANMDVHIKGPDATVAFCPVGDATASRMPDQGDHTGGAHSDGTQHIEGEADADGRFIFGVTSATEGATQVFVWADATDDDTPAPGESAAVSTLSWGGKADREISIKASSRRVRKGRNVRFTGAIDGDEGCSADQAVFLKARRPGARFKTVASTVTGDDGRYSVRVKVRRTKDYRAVAPSTPACKKARSSILRVRAV